MGQLISKVIHSEDALYRYLRYFFIFIILFRFSKTLFYGLPDILSTEIARRDFLAVYLLPKAIASGIDPYRSLDLLAEKLIGPLSQPAYPHPSPHPPTVGLLLLPLSLLNYQEARLVWFVFEIICLLLAYALLFQWLKVEVNLKGFSLFAMATLSLIPIQSELLHGNLHAPILLLLAASCFLLTRHRNILAGALLGLAVLIKQIAAPMLLIFLIRKEWKGLISSLLVIASWYLLSAHILGIDTITSYYTEALPLVSGLNLHIIENSSLWTLGLRLFHGMIRNVTSPFASQPIVYCQPLSTFFMYSIPFIIILYSLFLLHKMKSLNYQCAYLVGLVCIVSPFAWNYYYIFALIPASIVLVFIYRTNYSNNTFICMMLLSVFLIFMRFGGFIKGFFHSPLSYFSSILFMIPTIGVLILLRLVVKLDREENIREASRLGL